MSAWPSLRWPNLSGSVRDDPKAVETAILEVCRGPQRWTGK